METLRKALDTAICRIEDMLKRDDGQAWKEARKALPGLYDALNTPEPINPLTGKYADVLVPFVNLMEKELHANAIKGDRPAWIQMPIKEAVLELHYHVSKLHYSVRKSEGDKIAEHAADVANCAMMLLDVCTPGGLIAQIHPVTGNQNHELMQDVHKGLSQALSRDPRARKHVRDVVLANGMTDAETRASASVAGLSGYIEDVHGIVAGTDPRENMVNVIEKTYPNGSFDVVRKTIENGICDNHTFVCGMCSVCGVDENF